MQRIMSRFSRLNSEIDCHGTEIPGPGVALTSRRGEPPPRARPHRPPAPHAAAAGRAGGFDYLLKVRVTGMESYRRFLGDRIAAVRGVQQTHTYFVMEEVKSTHRIVVPDA